MLVMLRNVNTLPEGIASRTAVVFAARFSRTEAADDTDMRSNATKNPGCPNISDSPGFI